MTTLYYRDAHGQEIALTPNDDPAKGAKQDAQLAALNSVLAQLIAVAFGEYQAIPTPLTDGAVAKPLLGVKGQLLQTPVDGNAQVMDFTAPVPVYQAEIVSVARLLSAAASVNATLVKAAAGVVYRISGYNAKASAVYLKLYDKVSAPTVGTDAPIRTEYLAASSKFVIDLPGGLVFRFGIGFALTLAGADADATVLVAGDVLALNLDYA